jgi:hypothetical protein
MGCWNDDEIGVICVCSELDRSDEQFTSHPSQKREGWGTRALWLGVVGWPRALQRFQVRLFCRAIRRECLHFKNREMGHPSLREARCGPPPALVAG